MPNQRGFAHILGLIIILIGIVVGVILVKNPTYFKPKADFESKIPETSFTLQQVFSDKTNDTDSNQNLPIKYPCDPIKLPDGSLSPCPPNQKNVKVNLLVRSDIDATNLFSAKLKFDPKVLQVQSIQTSSPNIAFTDNSNQADQSGYVNKPILTQDDLDSGKTYTYTKGTSFRIQLKNYTTQYSNSVSSDPSGIIETISPPDNMDFIPEDFVQFLRTISPGTTTITVTSKPLCKPGEACPHFARASKLTITVVDDQPPSTTSDYFIKNWVDQTQDNASGTISLVGGVPTPGFQTKPGQNSPIMATITFSILAPINTTVSFEKNSAIYRNSDNLNILNITRNADLSLAITLPGQCKSDSDCSDSQYCYKGPFCMVACSTNSDGSLNCPVCSYAHCIAKSSPTPPPSPVECKSDSDCSQDQFCHSIAISCTNDPNCKGGIRSYCETKVNPPTETPPPTANACKSDSDCNNGQVCILSSCPVPGPFSFLDQFFCSTKGYCGVNPKVTPPPAPKPGNGDANGDSKIDLTDLSALLSNFSANSVQPVQNAAVDLNGDGKVNGFDFSLMVKLLVKNGNL